MWAFINTQGEQVGKAHSNKRVAEVEAYEAGYITTGRGKKWMNGKIRKVKKNETNT